MSIEIFSTFNNNNSNDKDNNNSNSISIYEKGVLFSDGGANTVVIKDVRLFRADTFQQILKKVFIKGVGNVSFTCEGTGPLVEPFNDLIGLYIPTFPVNIIGEYVARLSGFCYRILL